jgi:DNA-binding MarR family transcriptional regulator
VGYQRRLDAALAEAGFDERRFPDGRILRRCARGPVTTSGLARELGITRQGTAKLVADLVARGFVTVTPSSEDGREKVVALTPRADAFLASHRRAARRIQADLQAELGPAAYDALLEALGVVGGREQPGMREYLRAAGALRVAVDPDDS